MLSSLINEVVELQNQLAKLNAKLDEAEAAKVNTSLKRGRMPPTDGISLKKE